MAAQNQAISLDPGNPRLRLDLGGVYYSLQDYQTAGQAFAAAVTLKPDYPNAHYNLAQAEKMLKLNSQAIDQLQQTAVLVCANPQSPDCSKVNDEIRSLGSQPASPSAETSGQKAAGEAPLATAAARTNLPNAATKPPVVISSPSGQLTP